MNRTQCGAILTALIFACAGNVFGQTAYELYRTTVSSYNLDAAARKRTKEQTPTAAARAEAAFALASMAVLTRVAEENKLVPTQAEKDEFRRQLNSNITPEKAEQARISLVTTKHALQEYAAERQLGQTVDKDVARRVYERYFPATVRELRESNSFDSFLAWIQSTRNATDLSAFSEVETLDRARMEQQSLSGWEARKKREHAEQFLTRDVKLTDEETSRVRTELSRAALSQKPSESDILTMKKRYVLDSKVYERIMRDTKFTDKNLRRDLENWWSKQYTIQRKAFH